MKADQQWQDTNMFRYIAGAVVGFALAVAVGASLIHWGPFYLTKDELVEQIDAQTIFLLNNLNACAEAYAQLYKKGQI